MCRSYSPCVPEHRLVGRWSSSLITYPDDPIFNKASPITEPGRAVFQFQKDHRFIFNWDDSNVSGFYHIKNQKLILTSEIDNDTARCLFDLKGDALILEMDDGFRFELKREE